MCNFNVRDGVNRMSKGGFKCAIRKKREQEVAYYSNVFWNEPKDKDNSKLETEMLSFLKSMNIAELRVFYEAGRASMSIEDKEYEEWVELNIRKNEKSFKERGVNMFGITDQQLDEIEEQFREDKSANRFSAVPCPMYRYPYSCERGDGYSKCISMTKVSQPGDTDCDYGLVFFVGPYSTLNGPLKLESFNWRAWSIITMGRINYRNAGIFKEILVGAGRVELFYSNPYQFKGHIRAGV